jgi:hypothetical protein
MRKLLALLIVPMGLWGQIFQQDFSSSSTVSDYVYASPGIGQFNAISTSGAGTVASITSNKLRFVRTAANAGSFSRTTDFSPTPVALIYTFQLSVSGNSAATTTAAVWQLGSGYGTANSSEAPANTHSRIGLNLTATNGQFSLRNIGVGNTGNYTGEQNITWVINNSGSTLNYKAPDGSNESVADDRVDLWIGTTRESNDIGITTASQNLTDLKFVFDDGSATIDIDNIKIERLCNGPATLPTSSASNLTKFCTDNQWDYYGNSSDLYFAMNKNGNIFTDTVAVTVSSASVDSSKSSNGANQEHASYLMKRFWNVNCGGCAPTINGGISVRFFYNPADSTAARTAMRNGFLALKASNTNTLADTTTSMQWVKNNTGAPYAPSMFTGNRMTVAHIKLSPTYGTMNGVRYVEFSGIQSFSGGGGGFGFGPSGGGGIGLPVTWAGFDAIVNTDHTELLWQTASEQNTSHFEVEASEDGKEFKTISENIPAAGNSASLLRYSYIDRVLAPIKYYRLKQIDIEGSFEYSKIIVAKRNQEANQDFEIIAYPYSHTESKQYQLFLKNTSADVSSTQVLDYTGKPVYKANTTNRSEILDLSHLTSGIYMLSVWNGGERQVVRIAL